MIKIMDKISFRWRITVMTVILIAATCIAMNLLAIKSGSYYIDSIGDFLEKSSTKVTENDGVIYADMTPEQFADFFSKFQKNLDSTKGGFSQNIWIITLLTIVISGVIAYFAIGIFMKPLKEFSVQAKKIQPKNLTNIKLNENTVPEFSELSQSINQMLDRLLSAFNAQKQFAGNAAHELRTPLALMQTKLDTYDESTTDSKQAAAMIKFLSEQTERLSTTIKTLLDMSELSEIPRDESIELVPLIEEVLVDLSPLAEKNNISLSCNGDFAVITGSDILIYRAIYNLVENAIKYNRKNGSVVVSLILWKDDIRISITDTGYGIPADSADIIFQPFFRADKSRYFSPSGAGLGLPLVQEIISLHGGSIALSQSSDNGTVFTVSLPSS